MQLPLKRTLYSHIHENATMTIVFTAGIHGNEPAGIYGIQRVIERINKDGIGLSCNVYAFAGNLKALRKNIRFENRDLNRLWTKSLLKNIKPPYKPDTPEEQEQLQLFNEISAVLERHRGTFVFVDLHTTSAETIPFITISDSLNNRRLASKFHIPIILGIEEYIEGPLLTYINEFGHIALGFEAGQHTSKASVDNCEAFVWLLFYKLKAAQKEQIPLDAFEMQLHNSNILKGFFEINYRLALKSTDSFQMYNGFENFETVEQNQPLALYNGATISAKNKGLIFMPLYQNQGSDGLFIINEISSFWLGLSAVLRKLRIHNVLKLLPGISKDLDNDYTLVVNPKTAKYLATELFHLFGYRKKLKKNNKLYFIKRDRKVTPFH